MEYWTKKLQACLHSGMQRIPARLANAVAVVAAVAVAASLVVTLSRTAADDQNRASAARMATAVAYARAHDNALTHASNETIETQIAGMAKNISESGLATGTGADFLGVSKSGSTLWFNKADVVGWAVASSALIIASLTYMGVELEVAYEFLHALIDTLWAAAFDHHCAWFTFRSPRSLGMYAC